MYKPAYTKQENESGGKYLGEAVGGAVPLAAAAIPGVGPAEATVLMGTAFGAGSATGSAQRAADGTVLNPVETAIVSRGHLNYVLFPPP